MNFWKAYKEQGPRGILVQGLVGVLAGVVITLLYTFFTGENGFRRFALPVFGVPLSLTILKLLMLLGEPKTNDKDPKDRSPNQ